MTTLLYVDTSAYLCVLLGERTHKLLVREMEGAELCSSVLLVLEATRNLVRLSREGVLTPAELRRCLDRLDRSAVDIFKRFSECRDDYEHCGDNQDH